MHHESYHYASAVCYSAFDHRRFKLTGHFRLGCTLLRERNPISTRVELGCLGLAGVFWLCENHSFTFEFSKADPQECSALGGFLATSDSDTADVECFASADLTSTPIDMPGCKSLDIQFRQATYISDSFYRNLPSTIQSARSIFLI
jgi:hypothetical protein